MSSIFHSLLLSCQEQMQIFAERERDTTKTPTRKSRRKLRIFLSPPALTSLTFAPKFCYSKRRSFECEEGEISPKSSLTPRNGAIIQQRRTSKRSNVARMTRSKGRQRISQAINFISFDHHHHLLWEDVRKASEGMIRRFERILRLLSSLPLRPPDRSIAASVAAR